MKKIVYFLDYFVFIATTLAIAGVFHEGMTRKWFSIVVFLYLVCIRNKSGKILHKRIDKWYRIRGVE